LKQRYSRQALLEENDNKDVKRPDIVPGTSSEIALPNFEKQPAISLRQSRDDLRGLQIDQ
jgi:hypothetical protein